MKWSEAIDNIDWNDPEQVEDWTDISNLAADLHFDFYSGCFHGIEVQQRVKVVWLKKRLCTDTYVGSCAYFLDKELVAISQQDYRRSREQFYYISACTLKKLRDFFYSLQDSQEDSGQFANLNEDIPLVK